MIIMLLSCNSNTPDIDIDDKKDNNIEEQPEQPEIVEPFKEPDTKTTVAAFAGYVTELEEEYKVTGLSVYKRDYLGKALESLKDADERFKEESKDKDSFNKKVADTSAFLDDAIRAVSITGLTEVTAYFTENQRNRLSYYKNGFTNLKTQVGMYEIK